MSMPSQQRDTERECAATCRKYLRNIRDRAAEFGEPTAITERRLELFEEMIEMATSGETKFKIIGKLAIVGFDEIFCKKENANT